MIDLVKFLEARIAEDEALADDRQREGRWTPAQMRRGRAEVAAKREILAQRARIDNGDAPGWGDEYAGRSDGNYDALVALARVYEDHPDWQKGLVAQL